MAADIRQIQLRKDAHILCIENSYTFSMTIKLEELISTTKERALDELKKLYPSAKLESNQSLKFMVSGKILENDKTWRHYKKELQFLEATGSNISLSVQANTKILDKWKNPVPATEKPVFFSSAHTNASTYQRETIPSIFNFPLLQPIPLLADHGSYLQRGYTQLLQPTQQNSADGLTSLLRRSEDDLPHFDDISQNTTTSTTSDNSSGSQSANDLTDTDSDLSDRQSPQSNSVYSFHRLSLAGKQFSSNHKTEPDPPRKRSCNIM